MKIERCKTDVLIIGGGTAGCYAALTIADQSDAKVLICEKAHIKRSGCLAAGVNALNAYITEGRVPQDYVDYARKDADGIVRGDLLLTMSERLNQVTEHMERLGLVILKDANGKYVARGNRNLKINGENMKPILAKAVEALPQVTIRNHVNITDFFVKDNRIQGAFGFNIQDGIMYVIEANAVMIATGGAAGLYKPNHPGFSRHKMSLDEIEDPTKTYYPKDHMREGNLWSIRKTLIEEEKQALEAWRPRLGGPLTRYEEMEEYLSLKDNSHKFVSAEELAQLQQLTGKEQERFRKKLEGQLRLATQKDGREREKRRKAMMARMQHMGDGPVCDGCPVKLGLRLARRGGDDTLVRKFVGNEERFDIHNSTHCKG